MWRCPSVVFPVVMLLLVAPIHSAVLGAQQPPVLANGTTKQLAAAPSPLPTPSCTVKFDNDSLLHVSLPDTVLDYLEQVQGSAFVHAFLLGLVADPGAGHHRVSECARAFLRASPSNLDSLLTSYVDAPAIISELRQAEQRRKSLAMIADSTQRAVTLVTSLTRDTSSGNLLAVWKQIQVMCTPNLGATVACTRIGQVVQAVGNFYQARVQLDAAEQRKRAADSAVTKAPSAGAIAISPGADTNRVKARINSADSVTDALQKSLSPGVDTTGRAAELLTATAKADSLQHTLSELRNFDFANRAHASADSTLSHAKSAADYAYQTMVGKLDTLERVLDSIPKLAEKLRPVVTKSEAARIAPLTRPESPELAPDTRVPPGSILVALSDFIVARAQREVVTSFIVNLHRLVRREPILMAGFPDSWALMRGLAVHKDGVLDAVDVGRVPLTAWRATLASDFANLPVNLVAAGPDTLCVPPGSSSKPAQPRVLLADCTRRLAMLQPLATLGRKLMEGESLLEVLRRADSLFKDSPGVLPPEWHRLSQGLSVLGSIADAFAVQGVVTHADIIHQPYILSLEALRGTPARQRSAFIRVLVLRSVRFADDVPRQFPDTVALYGAIADGVRVVSLLASAPLDSIRRNRAELAQRVHVSFEAMGDAAWVAQLWSANPGILDSTRTRWRAFGSTLEPIIAGNFGLALSRSIVLLRTVRGVDLPPSVVTLTALASSLSDARNAEQMQVAFETAASPSGGWQAKRYGVGGAMITAYPGLSFGREWVLDRSDDPHGTDKGAWITGPSLPVGIEWIWPRSSESERHEHNCAVWVACGWGVYLPILDLGTLMTYRWGHADSVQAEPNTSLRQVFAPGLYFSVPLTRTVPVTFMLGGQFTPALRTVETRTADVSKTRSAWRIGGGLALDVVLFHF